MLEVLTFFSDILTPIVKDGKFNDDSPIIKTNIPMIKLFLELIKNRLFIYNELSIVYKRSFVLITKGIDYESRDLILFLLKLLHGIDHIHLTLDTTPEEFTIVEALELYWRFYELFSQILIIYTKALHLEKEKQELKDPTLHQVKKYLDQIDPAFMQVYNKYIQKIFRHKYAHTDWLPLDENRFYFLRKKKKIIISKDQVEEGLVNLFVFVIAFADLFMRDRLQKSFQEMVNLVYLLKGKINDI